jgi:hypothetical protein
MSRYSPMNPEYKAKWLKALRGGKYKQAKGVLQAGDGRMCCLGVLCDIVNPKEWEILSYTSNRHFRGDVSYPDKTVMEETGLTLGKCRKLADLNDSKDYSFKQIADFIEKNF